MKIAFVIDKVNYGGAERQLVELLKGIDKTRFDISLIIFVKGGDLWGEIHQIAGVKVVCLHRKHRWDIFSVIIRLFKAIKSIRPNVIHGYMLGTNELCFILARLLNIKVVWGIRNSNIDFLDFDWFTRLKFLIGTWMSRYVDLMIANSESGKNDHIVRGYSENNWRIIPNGINITRFYPNRPVGEEMRSEWGIKKDSVVIGIVGRIHPMKDHTTFLKAAAMFLKERGDAFFICIGTGSDSYKRKLHDLENKLNISHRTIWTGTVDNMCRVYNVLDVLSSSSAYGEGFSNAIGEAMACGVLCVVTDVGDSGTVLGDAGFVIPPRNQMALVEGWKRILNLSEKERTNLSIFARNRIKNLYSLDNMVDKTVAALLGLMDTEHHMIQ